MRISFFGKIGCGFVAGIGLSVGLAAYGMAHAATPGIPLSEKACIVVAAQALTDYGDRGPTLTAFRPAVVGGRPGCDVELMALDGSYIYASGTTHGAELSQFEAVRRDWAKPPAPVPAKRQKARTATKHAPKGPQVTTR